MLPLTVFFFFFYFLSHICVWSVTMLINNNKTFRLDIRKKRQGAVRVLKHWNRLPKEAVRAPSHGDVQHYGVVQTLGCQSNGDV